MNAVRLERRVWTVLLDQTSLAGVLELGRRETLLVRIGVVHSRSRSCSVAAAASSRRGLRDRVMSMDEQASKQASKTARCNAMRCER
jgi:hypothetical protein